MDQAEIDNWAKIATSMEANGDTESWFYLHSRAIADGKPDPMPNVSQLVQDTVSSSRGGLISSRASKIFR